MTTIDLGYIQLNKFGEHLCGDNVSICKMDNGVTITLADGLGSGVQANILSILTSKIMSTMLSNEVSIEECVATIVDTLPVNKQLNVAYSTFTSICVNNDGSGYMIEFDNPEAILVRGGKCYDFARKKLDFADKNIYETKLKLEVGDYIVVMSDGATHAGVGITLDAGWSRESIKEHLNRKLKEGMSATEISQLVVSACNDLYLDEPSDDTSCMAVGIIEKSELNVMIGPPSKPKQDEDVCKKLLETEGKIAVCGGTTAKVVANYLNKPIDMDYSIIVEDVPPISSIEGIDLVTEGALTISKVVKMLELYNDHSTLNSKVFDDFDGASLLLDMMLKSTDINLLIGQTINLENEGSVVNVEDKQKNIRLLIKNLKLAGKKVKAIFY